MSADIVREDSFMEGICMKKAVLFFVLVLTIVGSCAAQNSNNAQKIIGTWTDQGNLTWVFSADGKLTISNPRTGNTDLYKYVVTDTKLSRMAEITNAANAAIETYDILLSADGKTLVLANGWNSSISDGIRITQIFSRWLTKK